VLSIAYGLPLAVLDGNVARVLSRLLTLPADVRDTRGKQQLWECAASLLDPRRPGDFNQAMMELGATVCVPAVPHCGECPLAELCRAHKRGVEAKFPPARRKQRETSIELVSAIVRDAAGRVLLQRRANDSAWLPGFWEAPTWETQGGTHAASHQSDLRDYLQLGRALGSVRHGITRFRIVAHVREADIVNNGKVITDSAELRWASLEDFSRLPISTITRKALRLKPTGEREAR
jgi:A/G-specific adenine glycosylase